MRRSRRSADDEGSASLEFITLGALLLVPLVYLVLALSAVQQGSLAVEGASRQAARVFADTAEDGEEASDRAVRVTLADYGLLADEVRITCAPDPRDCLAARSLVTVTVAARVPLPLAPPGFPAGVGVSATSTQPVSRFAQGER